jgi:flavorubredoxin
MKNNILEKCNNALQLNAKDLIALMELKLIIMDHINDDMDGTLL